MLRVRKLDGYRRGFVKDEIAPAGFDLDFYTGEIIAVFLNNGNGFKIHIEFEFDRIVKVPIMRLQFFCYGFTGQIHNLPEAFKKPIAFVFFNICQKARGNDRDVIRRSVIDQNDTIAVADHAAIGLDDDGLHGIFFRLDAILFPFDNLQHVEADAQ